MNSRNRYYLPPDHWGATTKVLTGEEAHHCVRVLRQGVGDEVVVFDGQGGSQVCRISEASKQEVVLTPEEEVQQQGRGLWVELCQAIPKAGNMELIVQKAVELGVSRIQPLMTENTVVKAEGKKSEKWQRIALEACKQCGQNWLPEVAEPVALRSWLDKREVVEIEVVAALDPRSQGLRDVLANVASGMGSVRLLVGPEGDFSKKEYDDVIEGGFRPVSLGDIIMRVETATLYALSVLRYQLS